MATVQGNVEIVGDGQETKVEEVEEVKEEVATTTAKCAGDSNKYQKGIPIVSITFSLSKENPFEVNVGKGLANINYKKSEKKAYPILCEIKDFSDLTKEDIREPLKNKACIEKNLPTVLAPILSKLNALLLDQYNAYYDIEKYDAFVAEQTKFLGGEEKEEKEEEPEKEGEENKRKIDKLINILKGKKVGQITSVDDNELAVVAQKNGVDLPTLKGFLTNHKSEVFPLYLLPLKFYDNQIFMTNNGIVTNGKKVYAYNDISIELNKIDVTIDTANWGFIDEEKYKNSVEILNGSVENGNYIKVDEGFKKSGGNRKTLSQKKIKSRATKRNRK